MTTSLRPWYIQTIPSSQMAFVFDATGSLRATFSDWQEAELVIRLVNGAKEAFRTDKEVELINSTIKAHNL